MSDANNSINFGPVIKVSDLDKSRPQDIAVTLDEAASNALAKLLGIDGLKKLRLEGKLLPLGRLDWRFEGHLGATVTQPCVVTLAPVTTRIEEDVERTWIDGLAPLTDEEAEMPQDDTQEPLGHTIDIGAVVAEALALALPLYPRAEDAPSGDALYTEPGKVAMTDEETKPFAGLAGLRAKLEGGDSDPDGGSDA